MRRRRRRFTITMQSSVAMQNCPRGKCNCFYPVNEEEEKEEEKDKEVEEERKEEERKEEERKEEEKRSQLQCNLLQQCSRVLLVAKAILPFFPVNKVEKKGGGGGGGGGEGGGEGE